MFSTDERNREREGQRVTHRRGIERDTAPRRETTPTKATERDKPEKRPPTDQGNQEREAQRVPQREESREVERRGDLDRRRDQPKETSQRRSAPPRRGFERERHDFIEAKQTNEREPEKAETPPLLRSVFFRHLSLSNVPTGACLSNVFCSFSIFHFVLIVN